MQLKLFAPPLLAVSLFFAALPAISQTAAPYEGKGFPIVLGGGPAGYEVDWGHGRMYGAAVWLDWYPRSMPSPLRGLGVELEARDISLNRHPEPNQPPRSGQANTKEDTVGGGFIYGRYMRNFHPYVKGIVSQGSIDFITASPTYSHDTRIVLAAGGGIEYRIYRPIWVRADYEYQTWGSLFSTNTTLTPQGFTVGISYDFAHPLP